MEDIWWPLPAAARTPGRDPGALRRHRLARLHRDARARRATGRARKPQNRNAGDCGAGNCRVSRL